jgi:hypothetical protein
MKSLHRSEPSGFGKVEWVDQQPRPQYTYFMQQVCSDFELTPAAVLFTRKAFRTSSPLRASFGSSKRPEDRTFLPEARSWFEERACTIPVIAELLDVSKGTVMQAIRSGPYAQQYDQVRIKGRLTNLYPRACLGYVYDQTAALREIPWITRLWVPISQVCDELAVSFQTLRKLAVEIPQLELEPFREFRSRTAQSGRVVAIRLGAYRRLQSWLPEYAPDDWAPLTRLHEITGLSVFRLEKGLAGAECRLYRAHNDALVWHYRIADARALGPPPKAKPAGDWLTVHALSRRLHRPYTWVENHAAGFATEKRLDDQGVPRDHYPPTVEGKLRAIAEREKPAGDWLTLRSLARHVDRDRKWVSRHLDHELAEDRLDKRGQVGPHYPPATVAHLRAIIEQEKPADGWLTERTIAIQIGRTIKWVNRRLNHDLAENRLDSRRHTLPHYPPSERDRLKEESDRGRQDS